MCLCAECCRNFLLLPNNSFKRLFLLLLCAFVALVAGFDLGSVNFLLSEPLDLGGSAVGIAVTGLARPRFMEALEDA